MPKMGSPKLKIYCLSDLHLETYSPRDQRQVLESLFQLMAIDPTTPSLGCLAGDIGHPLDASGFSNSAFGEALKMIASHFTHTVYVAGNHEYYTHFGSIDTVNYAIEGLCTQANVKCLRRSSFQVPETSVVIHGCTLWSEISDPAYKLMNDLNYIPLDAYRREHTLDLEFLEKAPIRGLTNIALTHHLPSYHLIHPRFEYVPNISGFATHLDDTIQKYDFWMCGHTHEQVHLKMDGKLRVVTNPLGYDRETRVTSLLTTHVYEV